MRQPATQTRTGRSRLVLVVLAATMAACGRELPLPAVVTAPPSPRAFNWIPTVLPAHAATTTPVLSTAEGPTAPIPTASPLPPTPTLEAAIVAAAAMQGYDTGPPAPELAALARSAFGPNLPTRLSVPVIGLEAEVTPVGWHTEVVDGQPRAVWDSPGFSAGFLVNSAAPGQGGNVVFYGHNNILGSVFRHLELLRPGHEVQVVNGVATWRYAVERVDIFQEAGIDEAERAVRLNYFAPTSSEQVTLLSCWPFTNNSHRIVVVAKPLR